jgi:hypothetical protein
MSSCADAAQARQTLQSPSAVVHAIAQQIVKEDALFSVIAGLFYWQLRLTPTAGLKVPLIDFHFDPFAVLEGGPLALSCFVLRT